MIGPDSTALAAQATVVVPALCAALGLAMSRRGAAAWALLASVGVLLAAGYELAGVLRSGERLGIRFLGTADLGLVSVSLGLRADELSALVAVAVAVVAACVQLYSIGYFAAHDAPAHPVRYPAYAATVSLFTAAMMLVVHADDLLVLVIGWEVMGACSYLLVGHHSERRAARAAAVKAFLVTRTGDVGVILGIAVLLQGAGTTSISAINSAAIQAKLSGTTATMAALFILAGVLGKSAQFPLQSWLPDAMEGPTPISALIHAATMVAAGVFLMARLLPVFLGAPAVMTTAAVIAALTMALAAFAALAQDDLKRLLAWSTVSQVAYMLAAISLARDPAESGTAIFHLLMHAGFKGLLFLLAGVVIAHFGTASMAAMGGLRQARPAVAALLALGLAALAGIIPLSGFWSKEAVLSLAEHRVVGPAHSDYHHVAEGLPGWATVLVLGSGLLTTLITGMYAGRAYVLVATATATATGPRAAAVAEGAVVEAAVVEEVPETDSAPTHSAAQRPSIPVSMLFPLGVLALPTAFGGLLLLRRPGLLDYVQISLVSAVAGTVLALVGGLWAGSAARLGARDIALALPAGLRGRLRRGYDLDAVQDRLLVRPFRAVAGAVRAGDDDVVDAYPRAIVVILHWSGRGIRRLQDGLATTYVAWAVLGALLLGIAGVVLS